MKLRISPALGASVLVVLGVVAAGGGLRALTASARPGVVAPGPIGPAQDTFIVLGLDTPNGHLADLQVGWKIVDYWTLIQFDIPDNLGDDARVVRARLELYCRSSELERQNGNVLFFNQANRRWDERTLTWRTKPSATGPQFQWDPGPCVVPSGSDGVWKVLTSEQQPELLDVVNRWYQGTLDNNGFLINVREGATQLFTFTAQGDNSPPVILGKQPRLYLEFENAATPTFTPSITPTPTETPIPSDTPVPSETPTPTDTPLPTDTPTQTPLPSDTPTPTDTPEPEGIYLPIALANWAIADAATPEPVDTPAVTEEPTPEATMEPTPEATMEATPEATEEPTSEPTEEPTPGRGSRRRP